MPTYEYQCKKCSNVQEEIHSILTKPEIKCEICGDYCEKLFTPTTNFILKGSDWPSQGFKMKDQMTKKNERMKTKMVDRERSGEGVTKMSDIKKN